MDRLEGDGLRGTPAAAPVGASRCTRDQLLALFSECGWTIPSSPAYDDTPEVHEIIDRMRFGQGYEDGRSKLYPSDSSDAYLRGYCEGRGWEYVAADAARE